MPEPTLYFCRVCWNSKQWHHPTGEAAKLESASSYANQYGFGFEEWLNRPEWTVNGQRYAFLQPVNKSRENKIREILQLILIARDPNRRVVLVGEIDFVHILTRGEAATALGHFRNNGWHATMLQELKRAGGKRSPEMMETADPREQLNCRFRPEHLHLYPKPRPVPRAHRLYNLDRYQLSAVRPEDHQGLTRGYNGDSTRIAKLVVPSNFQKPDTNPL